MPNLVPLIRSAMTAPTMGSIRSRWSHGSAILNKAEVCTEGPLELMGGGGENGREAPLGIATSIVVSMISAMFALTALDAEDLGVTEDEALESAFVVSEEPLSTLPSIGDCLWACSLATRWMIDEFSGFFRASASRFPCFSISTRAG